MDINPRKNTSGLRTRIKAYGIFLLRWGWFAVLLMALSTYLTSIIPDSTSINGYQATLNIQVQLTTSENRLELFNTTTFFAGILKSPGTLNLAQPLLEKKQIAPLFVSSVPQSNQLTGLEGIITTTPVLDTNIVQLTATWTTSQDASTIVTTVYQAFLQNIHTARSLVSDKLKEDLSTDLVQAQDDSANTQSVLQNLFSTGHTNTSEYQLLSTLHSQQQSRVNTINQLLLQVGNQGFGPNDVFQLANTSPIIATFPGAGPTLGLRLELSPFVGLIMGLGGILLAARFSNRLPLRGRKREVFLPHIGVVIPTVPHLHKIRLQVPEEIASPCVLLLRRLKHAAAEHEKRIKLITVTSPQEKEGKSTIAAELALTAAQLGYQTLLIDAHPEHPVLHSWFNVSNTQGILNILPSLATNTVNDGNLSQAIVQLQPKLGLLTIGNSPGSASSTLQKEEMRVNELSVLLAKLGNMADFVILDSGSLLIEAYASNIAMLSDMLLLVVDANKSQSTKVQEATDYLADISIPYITVLNRTASEDVE